MLKENLSLDCPGEEGWTRHTYMDSSGDEERNEHLYMDYPGEKG